MARLNQWSFRGEILNSPYVRVRQITGAFGLPPLRGTDFPTNLRTGAQFVPKITDSRRITLELIVRDNGTGIAAAIFDHFGLLFADRTQGALANILDSGTRTGMAEVAQWLPQDMTVGGITFKGIVDYNLADPWLYGPTVSGSVIPTSMLTFGTPVISNLASGSTYTLAISAVSGQPIMVCSTSRSLVYVSSISDNFSTPYTWTRVDTTPGMDLWIGTGGVGTSGTVTVQYGSTYFIGGFAVPCLGASLASGLAAIDVHANATDSTAYPTLSLTASAVADGMVVGCRCDIINAQAPSPPWVESFATYYGYVLYHLATYNPAPLSALSATWTQTNANTWGTVGAMVKAAAGSALPAALSLTNPGTVLAEKVTLDILGPIANPTITNTTTGTSLTVAATVAAGRHLLIDTAAATAYNDGVNVIGSLAHSGAIPFLTLTPGVNALHISGSGCTGASLVTVSFTPPYV